MTNDNNTKPEMLSDEDIARLIQEAEEQYHGNRDLHDVDCPLISFQLQAEWLQHQRQLAELQLPYRDLQDVPCPLISFQLQVEWLELQRWLAELPPSPEYPHIGTLDTVPVEEYSVDTFL